MRKLHPRKGGFTLIELMIVVAIIGILAAIAIPNFLMFQLRSKTGEAKVNLAGIRTAQEGYFAEFGTYVAAAAVTAAPTSQKQAWPVPALGFDTMGWAPEGRVYFQYVATTNAVAPAPSTAWSASSTGDLDGTGVASESAFGYIHPIPGVLVGVASGACVATGVWNQPTLTAVLLNTVGACDAISGQSVF